MSDLLKQTFESFNPRFMETKHTPKPWHVTESKNIANEDGHIIAICKMSAGSASYNNISAEQLKANARLIAAAPELLEALVYAKKRIVLLELYTVGKADPSNMELIGDAIKKATT